MADDNTTVRNAFPAFRVYIFGTDVTADVEGVSVVWNIGNAPSSAAITLLSPNNKYMMSMNDIRAAQGRNAYEVPIYNQALDLEAPPLLISDYGQILPGGIRDFSTLKARIVQRKLSEPLQSVPIVDISGNQTSVKKARRYPFMQGRSVFHSGDPIRVAFRDPFRPSRWFWMFAGYVTDIGDNFNEDHEQVLSLMCEDVTREFKYARVNTNPNILDASSAGQQDVVFRQYTAALSGYNLPEAMVTMVFGTDQEDVPGQFTKKIETDDQGRQQAKRQPIGGVGNYNKADSIIFFLGGTESATGPIFGVTTLGGVTLQQYQNVIDHEVVFSDVDSMRRADATTAAPAFDPNTTPITDVLSVIGEDIINYPVDSGKLYMLLPDNFGPDFSRAADRDVTTPSAFVTEYNNRLSMIYDAVTRFDFFFYASPRGDLLVEMPLYDFDPDDFDTEQNGGFQERYIIRPGDVYADSGSFSDAKIRTQYSTTPRFIKDQKQADGRGKRRAVVTTLHSMVPQFGRRLEQGDPFGFITTVEGAQLYGAIALRKINADAYTMSADTNPRFESWPNRPHLLKRRNHIGLSLQLTHNIQWTAEECSTRMDLGYSRGWSGALDQDKLFFESIGGAPSTPLDYKALRGGKPVTVPGEDQAAPAGTQGGGS